MVSAAGGTPAALTRRFNSANRQLHELRQIGTLVYEMSPIEARHLNTSFVTPIWACEICLFVRPHDVTALIDALLVSFLVTVSTTVLVTPRNASAI
jgi:hypothetical protein